MTTAMNRRPLSMSNDGSSIGDLTEPQTGPNGDIEMGKRGGKKSIHRGTELEESISEGNEVEPAQEKAPAAAGGPIVRLETRLKTYEDQGGDNKAAISRSLSYQPEVWSKEMAKHSSPVESPKSAEGNQKGAQGNQKGALDQRADSKEGSTISC